MVPSTMDSPICGITMSVGIVPFHSAPQSDEANGSLYIKRQVGEFVRSYVVGEKQSRSCAVRSPDATTVE
jgi:hypothetical protein